MKRLITLLSIFVFFLQPMLGQNSLSQKGLSSTQSPFGINFGSSATPAYAGIDYSGTTPGHRVPILPKAPESTITWNGSVSTSWTDPLNWTGGVPLSTDDVVIPDATGTANDPELPATTSIATMTIQSGGILNGGTGTALTVTGGAGAWNCNSSGTFNPGTSTVIFTCTSTGATMAGTTDFYNVTIRNLCQLTLLTGNIMRIAGALDNSGTGTLHAAVNNNTIEYNGTAQTVINPNGTTAGYYHLILGGSGAKTMPASTLSVLGNFSTDGTATVNCGEGITIGGNVVLAAGTTFNAGSYTHSVAGNWTNNGATCNFPFPGTSTLIFNGNTLQTITRTASPFRVNNLHITNTTAHVVLAASTTCRIDGYLLVSSGALFDLAANQLNTMGNSTSQGSGTIRTSYTGAAPIPASKSWAGTVEYASASAQAAVSGTYTNLTMLGTGGGTADGDISVNGVLSLSSDNPSATKGILDMGANTLFMVGSAATTTGPGDVTGIVKRTLLAANVTYTYGNEFTSITFPNVGTMPDELSIKISIGTNPAWRTGIVKRVYDLIQVGGSGTKAVISLHYKDSELNGNVENKLADWEWDTDLTTATELGRSNFSLTNNWISFANVDVDEFSPTFDDYYLFLDESEVLTLTWNGSVSTVWGTAANWTPNGTPAAGISVIIPDQETTPNDPNLPATPSACGTMSLENNGVLNALSGAQLTVDGASGAWSDEGGIFNAGNSTVIFTNPEATINGITDFYNLTIAGGAGLTLTNNSITRVYNTFTNNGSLNAALFTNTVEYNGGSQNIINPNGTIEGYHHLILTGTGTKMMPSAARELLIYGDLTVNATIDGNGGTVVMNGPTAQIISGSTSPTFYNLSTANINQVTVNTNLTVTHNLTINNGLMILSAPKHITVNGTTTFQAGGDRFLLKSNATGTASFIDNGTISGTGVAKVERYLTNNGSIDSEWHLVSSPITNGLSGIFLSEYLMKYTEPTHLKEYIIPTTDVLTPTTGYYVWVNSTSTKTFSGSLNTGNLTANLTRTYNVTEYDGWNLIGNPYPSAIDLTGLTYTGVETSVYFWDPSGAGNFKVWIPAGGETHTKYAPAMQGFYVHCNDATNVSPAQNFGSVGFVNAARDHNSETFLKDTEILPNLLRIKATGMVNGYNDELSLYFNPERNSSYESGFDALKLKGNADAPQIYTKIQDTQVSVNALAFTENNCSVPMGFYVSVPGTYTLHATEIQSFAENISIKLEDLKLNTFQDLRVAPDYSFTYDTIDNADRFVLHFYNPTFNVNDIQNSGSVQIYSSNGTIFIQSKDGKAISGEVFVYDMIGKEMANVSVNNDIVTLKPSVSKGSYIVKVVSGSEVYTKKVIL